MSMDEVEITNNLTKIQEIITDELPSLPLYNRTDVNAAKRNLMNFLPTGTSTAVTWNAHLWYFEEN